MKEDKFAAKIIANHLDKTLNCKSSVKISSSLIDGIVEETLFIACKIDDFVVYKVMSHNKKVKPVIVEMCMTNVIDRVLNLHSYPKHISHTITEQSIAKWMFVTQIPTHDIKTYHEYYEDVNSHYHRGNSIEKTYNYFLNNPFEITDLLDPSF